MYIKLCTKSTHGGMYMTKNLILSKDKLSTLSISLSKTIFWVGAGIGAETPCNLPLGNGLTDAFLKAMLGDEQAEKFILYWNNHIPKIRDSIKGNNWNAPTSMTVYTPDDVRSGNAWERPRLEFIIGEMNKLDQEFQDISFQKLENERRYKRQYAIESLSHFTEAEPNLLHYWLADFARAGATIVTANFDTCIEKALNVVPLSKPTSLDGVRGIETTSGFIYHIHGVAADENIQSNLGATINNVSKRLPEAFTKKLEKCFQDGYNIVFIGYSGLDFFDVQPFFEGLNSGSYPGKAIYLHFCKDDRECEEAAKRSKRYQYLLNPFAEKVIAYGKSTDFFDILGGNSGVKCTKDVVTIPNSRGTAFEKTKEQLQGVTSGMTDDDRQAFYFLNMFRLASQLNINLSNFYPDWGSRISSIYNDWKSDTENAGTLCKMFSVRGQINDCIVDDIRFNNWESTNSAYLRVVTDIRPLIRQWDGAHTTLLTNHMSWKQAGVSRKILNTCVEETCKILERGAFTSLTPEEENIERDTVHYLCGWQMKKMYGLWMIPFVRYTTYRKLKYLLKCIDRLLEFPFSSFMYRTYYLSLCRQRGAIQAMLGQKCTDDNGYYGDLQHEWNICMETPNLFDARLTIRARMRQYWILVCKLKKRSAKKYNELKAIYHELDSMRADSSAAD